MIPSVMSGSNARDLVCSACGFVTGRLAGLRSHQYAIHGRSIGVGRRRGRKRSRPEGWPDLDESSAQSSVDEGDEGDSSTSGHASRRPCPPPGAAVSPAVPLNAGEPPAAAAPAEPEVRRGADAGVADRRGDSRRGVPDGRGIAVSPLDVDEQGSFEPAVNNVINALFELTRTGHVLEQPHGRALPPSAYDYASLGTKVRAVMESLNDTLRCQPLVRKRRGARTGRFNTPRLKALLRIVLEIGRAGLTYRELAIVYDFMDIWCGTKRGVPACDDEPESLRDAFPSVNSFIQAVKDEVEEAVSGAGWRKVLLTEGGVTYEAYFRPVLDLVMELAKKPGVQLWSGKDGPAPDTSRRESAMDGDAFRECEKDVMRNNGPASCVLGVHAYSDGTRVSSSGGTSRTNVSCALDVVCILSRGCSVTMSVRCLTMPLRCHCIVCASSFLSCP